MSSTEQPSQRFVAGLDLSLTSTGVVASDLATGDVFGLLVRSKGSTKDSLDQKSKRHRDLVADVVSAVCSCAPVLVAVESLMFNTGRADSSLVRRGGLWWGVVSELCAMGIPVAEVSPSQIKLFATGKGNAPKDQVLLAAGRLWTDLAVPTNDISDAAWLAAIASYHLRGSTLATPTAYRDRAMAKIVWPDTLDRALVSA